VLSLLRVPSLAQVRWRFAILDEAQAIKNPNAKQTKAAKALDAGSRIALTGTPVENHLGDLWSIFDFINPGLLSTARQFARYAKGLTEREYNPYGLLRTLVQPYILRRVRTDKAKQICNHPSQWLGDEVWKEADSGKWARLREIAEVVTIQQEKLLMFTQFREITAPLATFLGGIFGQPGLVLHGETRLKRRRELVRAFQADGVAALFGLDLAGSGVVDSIGENGASHAPPSRNQLASISQPKTPTGLGQPYWLQRPPPPEQRRLRCLFALFSPVTL